MPTTRARFQLHVLLLALVAAGLYACSSGYMYPDASAVAERGLLGRTQAPGAGPRPGLDQELWVIARDQEVVTTSDEDPGEGSLCARLPRPEPVLVPVPLEHTDVRAEVTAFVATVDVEQRFRNPFDEKIEAVYTFPLPENAAVHEFTMTIGERTIRGIIREREEAERIYYEARRQGYVASLLVQDRPNVFTETVANIEPGKVIEVGLRYVHALRWHDGWFEFRFPMVVAPRYNPPGTTAGVGAVPRVLPGASGQSTEVSYLRPHERSGHDISLAVELRAGLRAEELHSPTHAVAVEPREDGGQHVQLREHDSIPNRDFVLRYRLGGDRTRTALLTDSAGPEGTFALMILPPEGRVELPRLPVELTFVIDRSGSMSGEGLKLARRAVRKALGQLQPTDRFNLISFANDTRRWRREAAPASERELRRALDWLGDLSAGGGTEIGSAVKAAFAGERSGEHEHCVAFLTDGHVGNEAEVLELLAARLGDSRVFSFAVGSASNQYLAESMARLGRGAVAFIGEGDDPEWVMRTFLERVTHPALRDVELDWGGLHVSDVTPRRLPDVLLGRPLIISGRFRGEQDRALRLTGLAGGRRVSLEVDARLVAPTQAGIPLLWARRRLAALNDEALVHGLRDDPRWQARVRDLALEQGLLSDYTAFLAVDSARRTEGSSGVTVPVPVPVPSGMRYETTVGPAGQGPVPSAGDPEDQERR